MGFKSMSVPVVAFTSRCSLLSRPAHAVSLSYKIKCVLEWRAYVRSGANEWCGDRRRAMEKLAEKKRAKALEAASASVRLGL